MPQVSASTIGLLYEPPDDSGVVVGRTQAIADFLRALARHGVLHDYALFCESRARRVLDAALRALPHPGPVRAAERAALGDLDKLRLSGWHDTDFDTQRPFAIRSTASRAYPVTLVHHTLSYKEQLHQILHLLLAKAHPFDAVICTSHAAREALRRMLDHVSRRFKGEHGLALAYDGRLEVVPLGVDTDRYRPLDRTAARTRFAFDPGEIVLLWLGRLSGIDKADLLPLLQSFAGLCRANPNKKLRLVCAGTDRPGERFGKAVSDYAAHLGMGAEVTVIREEASFMPFKEELYAAADIFVSPVDNVQETFGLTPIEAMACGIPQVVSDWDGYRDTVVDGETGFLVPTLWTRSTRDLNAGAVASESAFDHLAMAQSVVVDGPALAAAIQRLIDEPALRERMGRASRERAETTFSWASVIARYELLWEELSKEAELANATPRSGLGYAIPDWGTCFGHYASHAVDDATMVCLAELGRDLVRGEAKLFSSYVGQWQHLDIKLLERIVGGLVVAERSGEVLTVGAITDLLTDRTTDGRARDRIVRHVLFLAKYDYVDLALAPEGLDATRQSLLE
jgi:D-inositol-3-phosphate glycosyltransferase